jgi:hypothetical protein
MRLYELYCQAGDHPCRYGPVIITDTDPYVCEIFASAGLSIPDGIMGHDIGMSCSVIGSHRFYMVSSGINPFGFGDGCSGFHWIGTYSRMVFMMHVAKYMDGVIPMDYIRWSDKV